MNVFAFLFVVMVYLHLAVSNVSSALLTQEYLDNASYILKTYKVAKFIEDNYKEKLHLEYKDFNDLHETCTIVMKYSMFDSTFKTSDVLSLIIRESRLNRLAKNLSDGGLSYGQLTNIKTWHKEELFWVRDPFDKHQNIASIFILLNSFKKQYKTKYLSFKHYNGSTAISDKYAKDVLALSQELSYVNKF